MILIYHPQHPLLQNQYSIALVSIQKLYILYYCVYSSVKTVKVNDENFEKSRLSKTSLP